MQDNSYNNKKLVSSTIVEAKGIKTYITHSGIQRQDVIHVGIPTINPLNVENFGDYVNQQIANYDRYLGYPSGITANNIRDALENNLKLFTIVMCLKRQYDAKNLELPGGERTSHMFDVAYPDSGAPEEIAYSKRFANNIMSLSNAVWVSDIVSPFKEILLPQAIMQTYAYYMQNVFDISSRDTNEAVTFLEMWPEFANFSLINIQADGGGDWTLDKTQFDGIVTQVRTSMTPRVRDFLMKFLLWSSPSSWDLTRDLQGNTVNIIRDDKVIFTFNNIFPEQVDKISEYILDEEGKLLDNGYVRLYSDFELIMDAPARASTEEELVASKYYLAISGVALEGYLNQYNDMGNGDTINVDFTVLPLMVLLCDSEIIGSDRYTGCAYSLMSSININTGNNIEDRTKAKQYWWGNDIQLLPVSWNIGSETNLINPALMTPIIGDYGEGNDVKDQLAIFNFPVTVVERVAVGFIPADGLSLMGVEIHDNVEYNLVTNMTFNDGWIVTRSTAAVDHTKDYIAMTTYTLDPNEIHVAIESVMFLMLTGFTTYGRAINALSATYNMKQQYTD